MPPDNRTVVPGFESPDEVMNSVLPSETSATRSDEGQSTPPLDLEGLDSGDQSILRGTATPFEQMEAEERERVRIRSEIESGGPVTFDPNTRGIPHPERWQLHQSWQRSGEARMRHLETVFGADAMILGHLLFKIPPLAIRIRKTNITYRWKPLRTKESIAVKSGNGDCWIEIDLAFVGLNQINSSLAGLITLWKKVPFCFVENKYIRENMLPDNFEDSMALRLESLILDAAAGSPDVVWATLITGWFNYKPFSQNFWFRQEWRPLAAIEGDIPTNGNTATESGQIITSGETTDAVAEGRPLPTNQPRGSIVDLSRLESPGTISTTDPLEARLEYPTLTQDPGDPLIEPTSPVVYPFNSEPFMNYVTGGIDAGTTISDWNDNLVMTWPSFRREIVPASWAYNYNQARQVEVAIPLPSSEEPTPPTQQETQPVPVSGDRDIIIFMGDSIMKLFFGAGQAIGPTPATLHRGNGAFPVYQGFQYYWIIKVGINCRDLRIAWDGAKNDSQLRVSGGAPLSRVAGVVIHCGLNDMVPRVSELERIMRDASQGGAIPVLMPLPPEGDAPTLTPYPQYCGMRSSGSFGNTAAETWLREVGNYHQQMITAARNVPNAVGPDRIDYHEVAAEGDFRSARNLPLKEEFMTKDWRVEGGRHLYNYHINASGARAVRDWMHQHLPWGSLTGTRRTQPQQSDLWTVTNIEDGDTIMVRRGTENRTIRFQSIDCLEIGHAVNNYVRPPYSLADLRRWLPDAQDSWRPASARLGEIAKQRTATLVGGVGGQVRIDFSGGMDAYGRYLGVIFRGDRNVNLTLVQEGLAWAMTSGDIDGRAGGEYQTAQTDAGGPGAAASTRRRGIWDAINHDVALINAPDDLPYEIEDDLRRIISPSDFRRDYGFSG